MAIENYTDALKKFVQDHHSEDPAQLLFTYSGKTDFDLKAAVQQIQSRQKAKQKLAQLEQQSVVSAKAPAAAKTAEPLQQQLFVEAEPHPILEQLAKLDPDQLSARQALDLLYQLKASL